MARVARWVEKEHWEGGEKTGVSHSSLWSFRQQIGIEGELHVYVCWGLKGGGRQETNLLGTKEFVVENKAE